MKINVRCHKNNPRINQITKAVSVINSVQTYFFFSLHPDMDDELCRDKLIDWKQFCIKYTNKNDYPTIYITALPFDDNWFSHEESSYAIITINKWEKVFAPPSLKAYLIYQMVQVAISFKAELEEHMELKMVHRRPEGCMFDLCIEKTDIKLGMIAGNLCPQCKSVLRTYGIEEKALEATEKMLKFVRAEAIGKPIDLQENTAFIVMRFSSNDENDNAYKYGIHDALKELNIECIRADNIVSSDQILNKVKSHIEKSRFVIVKVDSNNLNVYFELGFAMGLDKDVLLVSEKELVLHLPNDLKNWECITYTKGNYGELKGKILAYYRHNYHYE